MFAENDPGNWKAPEDFDPTKADPSVEKAFNSNNGSEPSNGQGPEQVVLNTPPSSKPMPRIQMPKFITGLNPLAPVSIKSPMAWLRVAGYGSLAFWSYKKMKPVSYVFMSAAAVSLLTSMSTNFSDQV